MAKDKNPDSRKIIATNKDARFRYFINDTMEAGIVLQGTEVKSLRAGKVQMADSYVFVQNGEAFLSHLHIGEYSHGNRENHEPMRVRKLLLNKKEIEQLHSATAKEGMTIVPTQMYFKRGRAKVEIGLGKGKKAHDKRESIKERESKREMDRAKSRR